MPGLDSESSEKLQTNLKVKNNREEFFQKVVISGFSGRFPQSDNVDEFKDNLMKGVDMVSESDERWPIGFAGLPRRCGILKSISKFDASFFGVHPKQACRMDPQLRILLETTYEAILDAGVDPASVRGSRTGVFVGNSGSESHDGWSNELDKLSGYEMSGCTRSMFANRLSYFFDFKGPSYTADSACSSGLLVLDQALHAIRTGLCDSAVVAACNLCLRPATSAQFQKLSMLAPYGACRSFDASGSGYCRSEAVVSLFIQKGSDARRVYASLLHSKNNSDGFKSQGITYPSGEMQKRLLLEVYDEVGVDPSHLSYMELHGTGTKAGDPEETNAVAQVLCPPRRKGSLLIGSTKSNTGHQEPASGLVALCKVLLSMHSGLLPPNLHFNTPNPSIPALLDGRLKVVTEVTQWQGGLAGISSFGFGGSNVHLVMQSLEKKEKVEKEEDGQVQKAMPRLIVCSARTREGAEAVLAQGIQLQDNPAALALLHHSFGALSAASHPFRGCVISLSSSPLAEATIEESLARKRPIWLVFAGMGTQWGGMGADLMCLPPFRASIMRSHQTLLALGIDLQRMILNKADDTYADTVNSFVAIAAIQVALVDVLKELGVEWDGLIGHSVGELGCAYADGGLTAEETVLAAFWRGTCVVQGKLPPGKMAAVGLSWDEVAKRCPEGVVPACHNSVDTVTISGPESAVTEFVAQLQQEGVFAREVRSSGVAFHSQYMSLIAPQLKEKLSQVIKGRKERSSKWVSSSVPETQWSSELAKYSDASYHVNNLLKPVLFHEALQKVPPGAITIEVASHCLLQAILKRSLSPQCAFVGLMNRSQADNLLFFLSSLAKIYRCGVDLDPSKLTASAPPTFPVDYSVPSFASLVKWNHSTDWDVPSFSHFNPSSSSSSSSSSFTFDLSDGSDHSYLRGHRIDGRVLFPATGFLVLAWKALAKSQKQPFESLAVSFADVHIYRATVLPPAGEVTLEVSLAASSGYFEVSEAGALVVSGKVRLSDQQELNTLFGITPSSLDASPPSIATRSLPNHLSDATTTGDKVMLDAEDVYKELRLRGYEYQGVFQGIVAVDEAGEAGELAWNDDWISFLDTMLQLQVLGLPGSSLRLPTRIRSIHIDPLHHLSRLQHKEESADSATATRTIPVTYDKELNSCTSGCVEILGLHATVAPRRTRDQDDATLESYSFLPYTSSPATPPPQHLRALSQCMTLITSRSSALLTNGGGCLRGSLQNGDHPASEEGEGSLPKSRLYALMERSCGSGGEGGVPGTSEVYADEIFGQLRDLRLLDVVVENSAAGGKLLFVEVEADVGRVFERVARGLSRQPGLKYQYLAAGVADADLEDGGAAGVEGLDWKLANKPPERLVNKVDAVLLGDVLSRQASLSEALATCGRLLRPGGFMLVLEPTKNFPLAQALLPCDVAASDERTCGRFCSEEKWLKVFAAAGLEVVAKASDALVHTAFLLRKVVAVEEEVVAREVRWIQVVDGDYGWVEELKGALADEGVRRVWLRGDQVHSGVVGLTTCLRREDGGHKIRCVYNAGEFSVEALAGVVKRDLVMNVWCPRAHTWGSYRHLPLKHDNKVATKAAYVNVLNRGDLSSLSWVTSPLQHRLQALDANRSLCSVHYTSLNFRDIMLATGRLPPDAIPGDLASQDCLLGMEFAGVNEAGERVMGLLEAKGLATLVDAHKDFLWTVPSNWSLQEAATVPVAYCTAFYALVCRGRVRKGESVLVHSGSGAVGQAAIAIALSRQCRVYTTVGSPAKKEYLMKRFPELEDSSFANSRDSNFWREILRATGGRGVDVVLNSLSEDKLQSSLQLLAQHGRFLEIGKFDLSNDSSLGMSIFLRNISFHGILLDALFSGQSQEWAQVSALMLQGIGEGVVRPLQTTVFERESIEDAFRFMAQGKHIGKVVVKVRGEADAGAFTIDAIPRAACQWDKCYLLVGGLGGFGMELAQWLVDRGARCLVLTSRTGVKSGFQAKRIKRWKKSGVQVVVSTRNVADATEAGLLVQQCQAMGGGLGGVFNLAVVLLDGLLTSQSPESFKRVSEPKLHGTLNLDAATRQQCGRGLHWFVVFSSVSCGRGNPGQSNYAWSNSGMERICEERLRDGLPGLAIQWGGIGEVGVLVDRMGQGDIEVGGTLPQKISSCMAALDTFLNQPFPVVSSFVLASKKSTKTHASSKLAITEAVARIMGVKDPGAVSAAQSLGDLGLDSLMSVEIKQTLERDYDLNLPIKQIRSLTFASLQSLSGQNKQTTKEQDAKDEEFIYTLADLMPTDEVVPIGEDKAGAAVFLIPPIEGTVALLASLASRLTSPVFGLQCTAQTPLDSMHSLAQHYIALIKGIQPRGPYKLIGYSFGACVALEMALQWQQAPADDRVHELILLDGSHTYVLSMIGSYSSTLSSGDSRQVETAMVCGFVERFVHRLSAKEKQIDLSELSSKMMHLPDLAQRQTVMCQALKEAGKVSSEKEATMLVDVNNSFYRKLKICHAYKPQHRLEQTRVTLLRAAGSSAKKDEDYDLGGLCSHLTTHLLEGSHDTFFRGPGEDKVLSIINPLLTP